VESAEASVSSVCAASSGAKLSTDSLPKYTCGYTRARCHSLPPFVPLIGILHTNESAGGRMAKGPRRRRPCPRPRAGPGARASRRGTTSVAGAGQPAVLRSQPVVCRSQPRGQTHSGQRVPRVCVCVCCAARRKCVCAALRAARDWVCAALRAARVSVPRCALQLCVLHCAPQLCVCVCCTARRNCVCVLHCAHRRAVRAVRGVGRERERGRADAHVEPHLNATARALNTSAPRGLLRAEGARVEAGRRASRRTGSSTESPRVPTGWRSVLACAALRDSSAQRTR
jgi:hypothetical protein